MDRRQDAPDRMDTIQTSSKTKFQRNKEVHDQTHTKMATNRGGRKNDKTTRRTNAPFARNQRLFNTSSRVKRKDDGYKNSQPN